jgi:DNA helicase II / ATP-dependent DNA helicase PcrA
MPSFQTAYKSLNVAQRQAVDTIDGPVMVVAGPGTGKTQLLSTRVANILSKTDALPGNILCLTFTESAASAMRERLVGIIGADGYKVAIHTFHSFGTEVINHYPEYFYNGANFRPADELSSYEVLEPILAKLPAGNPLGNTINGEFTALRDVQAAISQLKKAGLTPDELLKILDHNETFTVFAEPLLATVFDVPRLGKKDIPRAKQLANELGKFAGEPSPVPLFKPLSEICLHELNRALTETSAQNSTKPLTAWRNRWLERNHRRQYVFKDRARTGKLRTVADIYFKYLTAMQERALFDFDDMILRVLHALEYFPELRFNLQEQYQYLLVDEFQDTNLGQLRLLQNLADSESSNGRPNVMVVGDDDQAIYAFQGAELGNILQFRELYREPSVITLTDNYRSTDIILQSARQVIVQGQYRLETSIENIDKTLTAHNTHTPTFSSLHQFANPTQEYSWIAQEVKQQIAQGTPPQHIAILARNHRQLLEILPFLRHAGISIDYERRNNVLEAEHIQALIVLARTVVALAEQRFDIADALLPELLSYDFWGLKTHDLWQLSIDAYKDHTLWLEAMLERTDTLRAIAEFLVLASQRSLHEQLDIMLDMLIGSEESQVSDDLDGDTGLEPFASPAESFVSPLRAYYFNAGRLRQNPEEYITMLSNLAVLRRKLRDYRPDQTLALRDFVAFIDLHQKTRTPVVDTAEHRDNSQSIVLMTAHKAKGLEFDTVFVLSCQNDIWGTGARSRQSSVSFPYNLPIEPSGQTDDDCLRLFFVAMTRARLQLHLCYYQIDNAGKQSLPAAFLAGRLEQAVMHESAAPAALLAKVLEPSWQTRHFTGTPSPDGRLELLRPRLETYQLSATHINNFIDVTTGGPQAFLLQNLLRFPQASTRSAVFGLLIHTVLQRAHVHLTLTGEHRPAEDILHDFELHLQTARLGEHDRHYLLEKGSTVLAAYLAKRHHTFTPEQKVEYTLRGVNLGPARLTGTLDLLEVSEPEGSITVTDYKTGRPATTWQGLTDFEKIKLHKYRQQLMLYKLMVEHSGDFGASYAVTEAALEFVEPDEDGTVQRLPIAYERDELERFTRLVQAVWQHIMDLDFPDTTPYAPNYKGLRQFEEDLLGGNI